MNKINVIRFIQVRVKKKMKKMIFNFNLNDKLMILL